MLSDGRKIYHSVVKNGAIVLGAGALPEGTRVEVRPAERPRGSPAGVLAAVQAAPHVAPIDVVDMMRCIEAGRRTVRFESPVN